MALLPAAIPLSSTRAQQDLLSGRLADQGPVPEAVQEKIASAFWDSQIGVRGVNPSLYFYYYREQCFLFNNLSQGRIGVKTHQDATLIAEDIRRGLSRSDVKHQAIQRALAAAAAADSHMPDATSDLDVEDEHWDYAIDLVARLMCMLDVGDLKPRGGYTGRTAIQWADGPLAKLILTLPHFQRSSTHPRGTQLMFTACELDTVAGLRVMWTQNLADHLLLKGNEVSIFNQAWFLKSQNPSLNLFPDGLVEETIRTLALLFGEPNKRSRRWYNKLLRVQYEEVPQDWPLDDCVFQCGQVCRDIGEYSYWQMRLKILDDRYKDRPKAALKQLWNDRRDGIQWYTLWVVVGLTLFFGLVQSVEGALQVYKAFNE